jgi:hypothetical protein
MDQEISIIEGGASAATCTCGDDLSRNGGFTHNYACPMTPKCPHMVSKRDPITGETIQAPCGSRIEPQYACHAVGCPCLPLCPHCNTPMNQRGVHNFDCPNRPNYSQHGIYLPDENNDEILYPQNLQEYFRVYFDTMRGMPAIPRRNPVSPPQIIGGDFEVQGDCSVCHDPCDSSQSVMKPAECNHCFHAGCLTPWIQDHSTCPNCRRETQTILRKN